MSEAMSFQIAQYIENEGLGTLNEDIFISFQPDSPNDCITIYDEAAPVYEPSHALAVDQYGIQVLVRNESYFLAEQKLTEIHVRLVAFLDNKFVEDGPSIWTVMIQTPMASIGKDSEGRNEWTAHYIVRAESRGDKFRL